MTTQKLSEVERIQRVEEKCRELGWGFHGWAEPYHGYQTKLILSNALGEWRTTPLGKLINGHAKNSPLDKIKRQREKVLKKDEEIVDSFFSTGRYVEGTSFKRLETPFWEVYCPSCDTTSKARRSDLQNGQLSCDCGKHKQKFAYINLITKDSIPFAIKFGICVLPKRRFKEQKNSCVYEYSRYGIWEFEKSIDCKRAEREIKKLLEVEVLTKVEMKDGFTETTFYSNLSSVIEIYEKFGGKLWTC